MTIILAFCALLIGAFGFLLSTQATQGVSIIAFGCLLAICARLVQASAHHSETRAALKSSTPAAPARIAEPLPESPLSAVQMREPGLR